MFIREKGLKVGSGEGRRKEKSADTVFCIETYRQSMYQLLRLVREMERDRGLN